MLTKNTKAILLLYFYCANRPIIVILFAVRLVSGCRPAPATGSRSGSENSGQYRNIPGKLPPVNYVLLSSRVRISVRGLPIVRSAGQQICTVIPHQYMYCTVINEFRCKMPICGLMGGRYAL